MLADVLKFFLPFFAGMLWCRILFLILPPNFITSPIRKRTGLKWHHLHTGVVLVLVGMFMMLFLGSGSAVLILLGLGLGLIVDEFILFLLLETESREKELAVYRKSFKPTMILFLVVGATAAFIVLLSL